MVVSSVSKRRALSVPLLMLVVGAPLIAVAADILLGGDRDDRSSAVVMLLMGAGALWIGLSGSRMLVVSGDRLLARSLTGRHVFERQSAVFGVHHQGNWRSSTFIVFVTDGSVRDDVADFFSEERARKAIVRLERALLPAPAGDEGHHRPRRLAAAMVRSIERDWKSHVDAAKQQVDAYYKSPAGHRAKYGLLTLVLVYAIAMFIYGVWNR